MYRLLKITIAEPLQILEQDTELMSIKFYSQTLWTTLNVSLLDKKLGGLQSSLCKDGARPGPRSMTQRPAGRPPNERGNQPAPIFGHQQEDVAIFGQTA